MSSINRVLRNSINNQLVQEQSYIQEDKKEDESHQLHHHRDNELDNHQHRGRRHDQHYQQTSWESPSHHQVVCLTPTQRQIHEEEMRGEEPTHQNARMEEGESSSVETNGLELHQSSTFHGANECINTAAAATERFVTVCYVPCSFFHLFPYIGPY